MIRDFSVSLPSENECVHVVVVVCVCVQCTNDQEWVLCKNECAKLEKGKKRQKRKSAAAAAAQPLKI